MCGLITAQTHIRQTTHYNVTACAIPYADNNCC